MTQRRIQDFGSPIIASSLKTINSSFSGPAILSGCDFVVDAADRLRVNAGTALTDQGVLIIEDEPKLLQIQNTSQPADYTVYYYHVDETISGGTSAILTLASGFLTASAVSGVILGYVKYPGGGIPLNTSHFIQPYALKLGDVQEKIENATWTIPINNQGYISTTPSGLGAADLRLNSLWDTAGSKPEMYLQAINIGTTGIATVSLIFPFKVNLNPFAKLQVKTSLEVNTTMTVSLYGSSGSAPTTLTATPLTAIPNLTLFQYNIPSTIVQYSNSLVYAVLQMSINQGRQIKIQAVGMSAYNLPV